MQWPNACVVCRRNFDFVLVSVWLVSGAAWAGYPSYHRRPKSRNGSQTRNRACRSSMPPLTHARSAHHEVRHDHTLRRSSGTSQLAQAAPGKRRRTGSRRAGHRRASGDLHTPSCQTKPTGNEGVKKTSQTLPTSSTLCTAPLRPRRRHGRTVTPRTTPRTTPTTKPTS